MPIRSHDRFADGTVIVGAHQDYGVPTGYKDVVSSMLIANEAIGANASVKIQLNPSSGAETVWTGTVNGGTAVVVALWLVLYPLEVLRVLNSGTSGVGATFAFALSGVRYALL